MLAVNPGHWLPFYRSLNQQLHRDKLCAGEPITSFYANGSTLLPWGVVGQGMNVSEAKLFEVAITNDVEILDGTADITNCTLSDGTNAAHYKRTVVIGSTPFECGKVMYWRIVTSKGTFYSECFQITDTSKLSKLTWSNSFPLPGVRYESFQQVAYFKLIWDRPTVDQDVNYEFNISGDRVVDQASFTERAAFECMYLHPSANLALSSLKIHDSVTLDDPIAGSLVLTEVDVETTPVGSCYSKFRITYRHASIESVGVSFEDAPSSTC